MNTTNHKNKALSIVSNREPSLVANGVEVYLTDIKPRYEREIAKAWIEQETSYDSRQCRVLTAFYTKDGDIAGFPFIVAENEPAETDILLTSNFARDFAEVAAGSSSVPEEHKRAADIAGNLTVSNPEEGFEGDFSDEEIRGIASTLRDADAVGAEFVQMDGSGVSVRDIAPWAVEEAERESDPFTVDGVDYLAFSGRGYTAVLRIDELRDLGGASVEDRSVANGVTVHEIDGYLNTSIA
ncbi:phage tail tube protein [Salinibacter sp.]|uniref:phage tail tube protein n=1 Tax=Salinibacter sp. TaxID=2065818 RepID=UPI0021E796C0|nr:phage tail tube protein [Salinibacter sp.]